MRYLFGFLFVCALGVMPLVGCSEAEAVECQAHYDCDDQNFCTLGRCDSLTGSCYYDPREPGIPCDFNGVLSGICIDGVCGENLCAGNPCDDGNECTKDICGFGDGSCRNENLNTTDCDWGGVRGVCIDGVCREDLCKGVVCDYDGNPCTEDRCNRDTGECSYPDSPDHTLCGCLGWSSCPGLCIPGPCQCCTHIGRCEDGECV